MKVLPSVVREKSLITDKKNLEHLYTFSDFPVFMGCVAKNSNAEQDMFADMIWDICTDTGLIQLRNLLPLDVLYLDQHNDGTGKVWEDHYKQFAAFLYKYESKNILEIGGAHNRIANDYWDLGGSSTWTTIEPNPEYITDKRINLVKGWFDESFSYDGEIDTVVHSHVLEHTYDPLIFIKHIGNFLKKGQRHIFTFPNLKPMLQNKWTNCLNFEHTAFLTEEITDYILRKEGFRILEKKYYGDPHSIFYATEKAEVSADLQPLKNNYGEYKKIFNDYIAYHEDLIAELNKKIDAAKDPVFMFGAHIFSQYLLAFGLKEKKITCILDNSPIKTGKRLYGSDLSVESPEKLRGAGPVNVILKAGIYNDEIKKQILLINNEVTFW